MKSFLKKRATREIVEGAKNMKQDSYLKKFVRLVVSEQKNNLDIPFSQWEDPKTSKWRNLGNNGKYAEAAEYMKSYIDYNSEKLEDWQREITLWHIGQMYAFANDYKNAIKYMSLPEVVSMFDKEWQLYARGTVAYLKGDISSLKKAYKELSKIDPDGPNLGILKAFVDNPQKPYKENY